MLKNTQTGMHISKIGTAVLISIILELIMLMLSAVFVHGGYLAEKESGYIVMGTLLAASFLGMILGSGGVNSNRLIFGLIHGMMCWAINLLVGVLLLGGQVEGLVTTGILILGGSLTAAIVHRGTGHKNKEYSKRRKKRRVVHYAQIGK